MKKPVHIQYTVSPAATNIDIARQCRLSNAEGEFRLETAPGWKHITLDWLLKQASSILIYHSDQNIYLALGCNFDEGKIETVAQVFPLDDTFAHLPNTLEQYESDFFNQQSLYKRAFEILSADDLASIKQAIISGETHYKQDVGTRFYSELDEKYVVMGEDGSLTQVWAVISESPSVVFATSREQVGKIGIENESNRAVVNEAVKFASAFTLTGNIIEADGK